MNTTKCLLAGALLFVISTSAAYCADAECWKNTNTPMSTNMCNTDRQFLRKADQLANLANACKNSDKEIKKSLIEGQNYCNQISHFKDKINNLENKDMSKNKNAKNLQTVVDNLHNASASCDLYYTATFSETWATPSSTQISSRANVIECNSCNGKITVPSSCPKPAHKS